jgi:hypothetical protein
MKYFGVLIAVGLLFGSNAFAKRQKQDLPDIRIDRVKFERVIPQVVVDKEFTGEKSEGRCSIWNPPKGKAVAKGLYSTSEHNKIFGVDGVGWTITFYVQNETSKPGGPYFEVHCEGLKNSWKELNGNLKALGVHAEIPAYKLEEILKNPNRGPK